MIETRGIEYNTKEELMDEVNERRTTIYVIMKIKIKLIGRLQRYNQFIAVVVKERINNKRTRGRPGKLYFLKKSSNV